MKRKGSDAVMMVHRWNRPLLSCEPCRERKRRCDRQRPCSTCSRRGVLCNYNTGGEPLNVIGNDKPEPSPAMLPSSSAAVPLDPTWSPTLSNEEIERRLQRLESAVFDDVSSAAPLTAHTAAPPPRRTDAYTPFGHYLLSAPPASSKDSGGEAAAYATHIANRLPPLVQARELFNHFAQICQPNWGVLHVPSARALLERTYKARGAAGQQGPVQQSPAAEDLLLLFSIFAAAAFNWTPSLLEGLKATPAEAKAAFAGYNTIAVSILDNDVSPVKPSTTALAALSNLAHLSTNSRGLSDNVLLLRLKCLVMARSMGVDRLDTRKSREERAQKGCNMIELEVQRRVWWNLVGFDWLNSFPGSPREGTYVIQPRHMNVGLPSNAPDELITEERTEDLPLSVPTPMTAFIYRVKLAEVCRKAVDTLPSVSHDTEDVDYSVVLELDTAFNDFLHDLPWFFRLDESSMAQAAEVCKQQPMLAVHRVGINFSAQTRLCRLHRPYHLMDPSSDARHAYSRTACIRAAHTVLELRRAMDDIGARVGIRPARSWIVMQHVFIAALILATDVSRDPDAAGADARRAKVLAACEVLERSTEESGALMEGVQKNLQALMAALRERKQEPPSGQQRMGSVAVGRPSTRATAAAMDDDVGEDAADETLGAYEAGAAEAESEEMQGSGGTASSDDQNMDLLWTEFLNIAPELDVPQWDMLLDDIELPSFAP